MRPDGAVRMPRPPSEATGSCRGDARGAATAPRSRCSRSRRRSTLSRDVEVGAVLARLLVGVLRVRLGRVGRRRRRTSRCSLNGGLPPSMSALNWTVSGALPSSGEASAQASNGMSSSSASAPATGGRRAGRRRGSDRRRSGLGGVVCSPPPPHPNRSSEAAIVAEARVRVMQGPPCRNLRQRRIVQTPAGLSIARLSWRLAMLLGPPRRAQGPRRPRARPACSPCWRGFPDRPLRSPREHFTGRPDALLDRLVAYYSEVSAGRLRIGRPSAAATAIALPAPRRTYVQRRRRWRATRSRRSPPRPPTPTARRSRAAERSSCSSPAPGASRPRTRRRWATPGRTTRAIEPPARARRRRIRRGLRHRRDGGAARSARSASSATSSGISSACPSCTRPAARRTRASACGGSWGRGRGSAAGRRPPHRRRGRSCGSAGWTSRRSTRTTRGVTLPGGRASSRGSSRSPPCPAGPTEYYLLENRARVGADARAARRRAPRLARRRERRGLPHARRRTPAHKLLHLVEADGRGDLDRGHAAGGNRGDAGDPWGGPPRWRRRAAGALLAGRARSAWPARILRAVRGRGRSCRVLVRLRRRRSRPGRGRRSCAARPCAARTRPAWRRTAAARCASSSATSRPPRTAHDGRRAALRRFPRRIGASRCSAVPRQIDGGPRAQRACPRRADSRGEPVRRYPGVVRKLIIQIPASTRRSTSPRRWRPCRGRSPGIDVVETLVIDDGSTDRTAEVARAGGRHLPAALPREPRAGARLLGRARRGAQARRRRHRQHRRRQPVPRPDIARLVAADPRRAGATW